MRAISLPTARSLATTALAIAAVAPASAAAPSTARAARWLRPVPGELARPFSYSRAAPFAAGAHRGADLAAAPGAVVRAACAGRVLHAGAVGRLGGVVSVRCGGRRVTYLPLARPAVRAGAVVAAGALLGMLARGHGGLHLGVRRERDRFGYEDPMALLARPRPAPPQALPAPRRPVGTPRAAARPPVPVAPAPARGRAPAPAPAPVPAAPAPARGRAPAPAPVAPAPAPAGGGEPAPLAVWAGLALLLPALAGSRRLVLRRRLAGRLAQPSLGRASR